MIFSPLKLKVWLSDVEEVKGVQAVRDTIVFLAEAFECRRCAL